MNPAYWMLETEMEQESSIKNALSKSIYRKFANVVMLSGAHQMECGDSLESDTFNGNCKLRLSISMEDIRYGYNMIEVSKFVNDTCESTFKLVQFFYEGFVCVWESSSENIFKLDTEQQTNINFECYQRLSEQFAEFLVGIPQELKFNEVKFEGLIEQGSFDDQISIGGEDDIFRSRLQILLHSIKSKNYEEALKQAEFLEERLQDFHVLHESDPLFHL